jgi:hypothetical protein
MSEFQCEECGCIENTALCNYHWNHRKDVDVNKDLCSACDPDIKKWHDRFERIYVEKGKWKTNRVGNVEHIDNGDTEYVKYEIKGD